MNIQKFTQKSIEAINDIEKVAYDFGNQEVEEEHLLYALLTPKIKSSLYVFITTKRELVEQYAQYDLIYS